MRLNSERITKISHLVKPDDVLTIVLFKQVKVIKILAEAKKRGSAPEARLLYLELNAEAAPQKMSAIEQTLR